MSYCRKGPESDVYVYQTEVEEGVYEYVCHECPAWYGNDRYDSTPQGMIEHLRFHQFWGDKVPDSAFIRLSKEVK